MVSSKSFFILFFFYLFILFNFKYFHLLGSFATASCTRCGYKVTSDDIRDEVFKQQIPICARCLPDSPESNINGIIHGKIQTRRSCI